MNWRIWGALAFTSVLITQFTNCDVYSESNLFNSYSSVCADESCSTKNSEMLELRINTQNDFPIPQGLQQFNVGGDCNEGGYNDNVIIWELMLDGALVASSQTLGVNGRCDKGRFTLFVQLPAPGLADTTGTRREHTLEVEIIGIETDGRLKKNPLVGRKKIFLVPL